MSIFIKILFLRENILILIGFICIKNFELKKLCKKDMKITEKKR